MKYAKWMLAILLGNLSFSAWADMDITPEEKLYRRSCATCHGRTAEKPAMGKSKIINQMSQEEILNALMDRKNGKVHGGGNTAKQKLSDEEVKILAAYLAKKP